MSVSREEFESLISEMENFRETILDEFVKVKEDMEKIKYNMEALESNLRSKDFILGKGQKRLD